MIQTRATIAALCAAFPGAERTEPFGPGVDVWKVGGKIFAMLGGDPLGVSIKCADIETAALIIEMGHAIRAPYCHASWIKVPLDLVNADELAERIGKSYALIRTALPKKVQAGLG
jgi:predicted DNA-binding protein (MmcQ/YjbR family)